MKKIKLLNLYSGIGGNVALLDRNIYEITSIEINPGIAAVYKNRFPDDLVIIEDASQYLLNNYNEFDMIWSSPPCPTHSGVRKALVGFNRAAVFPDMILYQIIIFLKHHFKGLWVVENVIPYYEPIITPGIIIDRHCYWSNFDITMICVKKTVNISNIKVNEFNHIDFTGFKGRKDTLIRNMVNDKIGLHIMNCAAGTIPFSYEKSLFDFAV